MRRKSAAGILVLSVFLFSGFFISDALAAVCSDAITVTNINDSGPGSLRAAAGLICPGGTIDFGVTGTITLTTEIPINISMTILGPGTTSLTISGNNASRIFNIAGGLTVVIRDVTLSNGSALGGGAIYNSATSTLTLLSSIVSGNTAAYAGAIYNGGNLYVTGCAFSNNTATDNSGEGGAIYNALGTLSIANSTFSGNSSVYRGGAVWNGGTLIVTSGYFSNNSAPSGSGGGIFVGSGGVVTITDSTFTGNSSSAGGALDARSDITISRSTFSENIATTGSGGGLYKNGGTATITNSTITGNNSTVGSGGGIANWTGTLGLTNCTLSGNSTTAFGGGLFVSAGFTTIQHSTITGNSALAGGGGVHYAGGGGGINFRNSVLSNNTGGNCSGTILDGNYNIDSGTSCGFLGVSLSSTDPLLGVLGYYGGSTQTISLLAGSPAINLIPGEGGCGLGITMDQRGVSRPLGSGCDAGAYEVATLVVSKTGNGTVIQPTVGINCGATCQAAFTDTNPVDLTATPDAGWSFTGWTGCDTTSSNVCTVSGGTDRTVTATFANLPPSTFTLAVVSTGWGKGVVSSLPDGISCGSDCQESFEPETQVTLHAAPGPGYTFMGWSGACSGTGDCTVTMSMNQSVAARFEVVFPLPVGQNSFQYSGVPAPSVSPMVSEFRPLGIGGPAVLGRPWLNLSVLLSLFEGPIDVYLAVYVPDLDPEHVYLVTPPEDTLLAFTGTLVPWKTGLTGIVSESPWSELGILGIPIPHGTYFFGVLVTPAGDMSMANYYLWITNFTIH